MGDHISNQRLPIPVGAKYAQRQRIRAFRLRALRFNRYFLIAAVGLIGAIGGAILSTQPITVQVGLAPAGCTPSNCSSFQIQNFTLAHSRTPSGDDVYQSEYGAMVVVNSGDQTHTGGSTTLNGQDMIGNCLYTVNASSATCTFSIAGRTLHSTDTKTSSGWDRHYSDGKTVKIAWMQPLFPVPFAFGE